MSKYMTTAQLSEKLQVTTKTIENWRKKGLPAVKIGRSVRFNPDDVFKWIEENNEE